MCINLHFFVCVLFVCGIGLQYLTFNDINIYGTLPSSIGNLENLEYLSIAGTYINGTIPNEFANLDSINLLGLDENFLHGTVPNGLSFLPILSLDGWYFSSFFFVFVFRFQN